MHFSLSDFVGGEPEQASPEYRHSLHNRGQVVDNAAALVFTVVRSVFGEAAVEQPVTINEAPAERTLPAQAITTNEVAVAPVVSVEATPAQVTTNPAEVLVNPINTIPAQIADPTTSGLNDADQGVALARALVEQAHATETH